MLNLFKPPLQDPLITSIDQIASPTPIDTSSYPPLEYYCRVSCDVVCPRIVINVKSIDLGSLQATAVREVDLGTLTNICDDILTVVFENVPCWLLINESEMTSGSLSQEESKSATSGGVLSPHLEQQSSPSTSIENRTVSITLVSREKRTVRGIVMVESLVHTHSLSESALDSPVGLVDDSDRGSVAIKHVISVRPTYVSAEATSNRGGKSEPERDKDTRQGNFHFFFK